MVCELQHRPNGLSDSGVRDMRRRDFLLGSRATEDVLRSALQIARCKKSKGAETAQ